MANPISDAAIGIAMNIAGGIIKQVLPDQAARDAATLKMAELQQAGEFHALDALVGLAQTEAASPDPWTSRARPAFLYVIYTLVLFGIPMGVLSAVWPDRAAAVATGFKLWLNAIPETMWAVFGACFSVYSIGRSVEKVKGAA